MAPENEAFRLGIQKCHNTIQDNVKDGEVFKVPGASILFRMLCSAQEMHKDSTGVHKMKRGPTLKGLLTNMAIKKEDKGPDGCETGGKTLGLYSDKKIISVFLFLEAFFQNVTIATMSQLLFISWDIYSQITMF